MEGGCEIGWCSYLVVEANSTAVVLGGQISELSLSPFFLAHRRTRTVSGKDFDDR